MTEKVTTVIGWYFLFPDFEFRGHPNAAPCRMGQAEFGRIDHREGALHFTLEIKMHF